MLYIRKVEGNSDRRENARSGRMTNCAQMLLVSLCGLMLCLPSALNAEVKTDEQWKYSVTDDGVEILLYRGNDTSVCVPDIIEGSKVYSIGANAFKQKNVASIEIPEGVSSIGRSAFEGCRQLKEVKLPNTLEKIDRWAFWNCKSLQVVQLPPNIKDPRIDAFKGCDSLREVHICNKTLLNTPPTTSTTDIRKMLGVSAKVKIVQYDEGQFKSAQSKLSESAQSDKPQLSSSQMRTLELVLDDSNYHFASDFCFPAEIAMTNITVAVGGEITLPTNIIEQATQHLAERCRSGESARMYDFESWVGTYTRTSRKGTEEVPLRYEDGATLHLFSNLKLTAKWRRRKTFKVDLYLDRTWTPRSLPMNTIQVAEGFDVTLPTGIVVEAAQKLSRDKSVDGWRREYDFANWFYYVRENRERVKRTIENGVRFAPAHDMMLMAEWKPHVGYCVRDGVLVDVEMNGHDTLVIPADVKELGRNLLSGSWWKNVEVAAGNKNFFLKNGVLCWKKEDSTDVVAVRLVKDCEHLVIPEEVNVIGPSAFEGWTNVTSVVIPAGVKNIPELAFYKTGIQKVDLPLELQSLDKLAFAGCESLEEVVIPDGVGSIEPFTFRNCGELKSVILGQGVSNIAENAFADCPKLANLVISSSIDKLVLEGLPDGIHITLPSTVRAFKLRSNDANKIERISLTIVTQAGAVTREVEFADLGNHGGEDGWTEWDWMRRQAELQTRSSDKEKALFYPADAICDAHPKLYRELCAGADWLWSKKLRREMGEDKNGVMQWLDPKFGILISVEVTFPSPGVSLEALLGKYKKQEVGRFWVGDSKAGEDGEHFYTGIIEKAKELFAGSGTIVAGDDELLIKLILCDKHWTENSKVRKIVVSSRKLGAALAELDRKEKAAMQEARERAEKKAQKKLDSEALDF